MAASFISELDSAAVAKKVLTELLDTDKHAPAGVIYANGLIVSTAAPYPVGGTLLSSLDTRLTTLNATATSILTAANAIKVATEILDNAIAGTEMQVDIVSGAVTMSGAVSMGVPTGNTKRQKQLRLIAATTSTDLWTPAAGKRIAVKKLIVTWQGANACRITIWQGANADVTFNDTEPMLFDHTVDANGNSGAVIEFPDGYPWETDTADHELHVTLSAIKVVTIIVVGDERT